MTINFTAPENVQSTVTNGTTVVTLDGTTYQSNLPQGVTMDQANAANGSVSGLANMFLQSVTNAAPQAEQFTASMEAGGNVFNGTFQRGAEPTYVINHQHITVK